ncbi:amino acid adenylation domain-containing protein [Nonomuraea sp. NPDC046802]|uniref:amino acid adenylation domain-containing protein n=1 Tax=Nonomuraea sp. NPDC046802 TaxID=3154919 RepID=UPI0033E2F946
MSKGLLGVSMKATSLPALFRAVARDHPDDIAIVSADAKLTYGELDRWSDALAEELRSKGVDTGQRVGVVADRTVVSVCAVLAVLKSGAAYVPLDPAYPSERLRQVARDTGLRIVVGSPDRQPQAVGSVLVDPGNVPWRNRPSEPSGDAAEQTGGTPAYIIHTSGSTGVPKGCVVTHGNVLALLGAALPLFRLSARDRWALFSSLCFDVSVWEMWGAFATGATLVLVPAAAAQSPEDMVKLLQAAEVTVLNQVPSIFRYLSEAYHDMGRPPIALRYLIFAGESVHLRDIQVFTRRLKGCSPAIVNMYGITEITVHATFKELAEEDLEGPVRSPIGRPLPHLRIELRDDLGRPVPAEATGEMWISGTGVTQGYLDRPDLTDVAYRVESGDLGESHYYRSGDLARYLPNGELEYVGRRDRQIKILGFRIEPGEIEAVLRADHAVHDVVVGVTGSRAGTPSLVAFVIPALPMPAPELSRRLRKYAGTTLPRHMIPSRYIVMDSFPVNVSGKVDRNALTARSAE